MDELLKDLNKNERISFPVKFELKVILDATIPEQVNAENIEKVLLKLEIPHKYTRKKLSRNGRYMSFTYTVTIDNYKNLRALYEDLKSVPGIKFAL